jgi:hypothetical protein
MGQPTREKLKIEKERSRERDIGNANRREKNGACGTIQGLKKKEQQTITHLN